VPVGGSETVVEELGMVAVVLVGMPGCWACGITNAMRKGEQSGRNLLSKGKNKEETIKEPYNLL